MNNDGDLIKSEKFSSLDDILNEMEKSNSTELRLIEQYDWNSFKEDQSGHLQMIIPSRNKEESFDLCN